ncbi:MAG: hypothetical protein JOZ94_00555 [Xanthobacteraceae bacterium]|nr:hypothetical protein [Xanthobacteraceae bacterium]MBV9628358.1 hypothetical protein [Xanthobacteraceae bacterium]
MRHALHALDFLQGIRAVRNGKEHQDRIHWRRQHVVRPELLQGPLFLRRTFGQFARAGGHRRRQDEAGRASFAQLRNDVLSGTAAIPSHWFTPSGERHVTVIDGIANDRKQFIESGIVYNRGVIPNLPSDLAVEVPIMVDAAGVHPTSLGPLPDPIAKLLSVQASVQQLAVEVAVHASNELALQALLIDPVVNSTIAAAQLLDELWEVNRAYIRRCM